MTSLRKQENMIHVGAINGVHGLLGDVKIKPFIEDLTRIQKGATLQTEEGDTLTLQKSKTVGQGKTAFKFKEISDRTAAENAVGVDLFIDRAQLGEEEIYADILDRTVQNSEGQAIGKVIGILDNGAHPILEVSLQNSATALIPYTEIHTKTQGNIITLTADGEACLEV